MENPLSRILSHKPVVVLDGALATELENRGADLNDPLWSARMLLEAPELIRDVHLDYFRAGADCATTASYQASVDGFLKRGLTESQALDLIEHSVHLAQQARDQYLEENPTRKGRASPFVAGSIGPYGAYLADGSEYRGNYGLSTHALIEFHRPRMAALVAGGADILACETIPCLQEARALVRLLRDFPEACAWISFSARDGQHTNQGELLSECAAFLEGESQVVAVGVNCSAPRHITNLVYEIAGATSKPILVYPNSGEEYDVKTRTWRGETQCDAFAVQSRAWVRAGARIVGGCCRTTPAHVASVRAALIV